MVRFGAVLRSLCIFWGSFGFALNILGLFWGVLCTFLGWFLVPCVCFGVPCAHFGAVLVVPGHILGWFGVPCVCLGFAVVVSGQYWGLRVSFGAVLGSQRWDSLRFFWGSYLEAVLGFPVYVLGGSLGGVSAHLGLALGSVCLFSAPCAHFGLIGGSLCPFWGRFGALCSFGGPPPPSPPYGPPGVTQSPKSAVFSPRMSTVVPTQRCSAASDDVGSKKKRPICGSRFPFSDPFLGLFDPFWAFLIFLRASSGAYSFIN